MSLLNYFVPITESTETSAQPDCQQESPEEDAVSIKTPVEPSIEPAGKDILQEAIKLSRALTDTEKFNLLTSEQDISDEDLDVRYFGSTGGRKRKQISFQRRWLRDYKWLRYGIDYDHQGGWCLPCILFLSESEKENLGAFVCTPFTNYNKTKELCEKHASRVYHLHAMDRAYDFRKVFVIPAARIDSQLETVVLRISSLMLKFCHVLLKQYYFVQSNELLCKLIN